MASILVSPLRPHITALYVPEIEQLQTMAQLLRIREKMPHLTCLNTWLTIAGDAPEPALTRLDIVLALEADLQPEAKERILATIGRSVAKL
jgi:hypothetical protein